MKGKETPVYQLDTSGHIVNSFKSLAEASISVGRANSSVSQAITNGTKCAGFYWMKRIDVIPNEVWLKHPIHPIHVSTKGRILYKSGRINYGYKLGDYLSTKFGRVHRLVSETFFPVVWDDKLVVDHINDDKQDNDASNLTWCSRQYNNAKQGKKEVYLRSINRINKPLSREF